MIIRHIPQSVACFGNRWGVHCGSLANRGISVGGVGRSYSGFHRKLISKVVLWRGLFMSVPLIVHPPIQRVAISRMWISQVETGASVLWCLRNVCWADEGYSVHPLRFAVNVDTEGLDSHRRRPQEVSPSRRLGVQCCIEVAVFSVPFGVRVGLAALSQSVLGDFWRVSTVYGQHCQQKVLVKYSFSLGWWNVRRGLKDVSSLSVSVGSDREAFIAHSSWCDLEGWVRSLFGKSFFFRSVARESVLILIFWRTKFLPAHWVGFVIGFWFCWDRPTKFFFFFSVLVVNDGDSEIVLFFGRASFALHLRSV